MRTESLGEVAEVLDATSEVQALRLVMDALPFLISFVTADERYGLVNKAYEDWFGKPREELLGRTLLEVIGPGAYEKLSPSVKRGLAGERITFEQFDVPYRYGGTRDVKVTFVPNRTKTGSPDGYVALLEDVSARRRLELERDTLRARAEEDARKRADFERQLIGIVSHDLRNPLGTILLGTQLLLRSDGIAEKSLRAIHRIQSAAERGSRMVKDLLDFTQARVGGGIPITPVSGNMHTLLRQIVEEVGMSTPERHVEMEILGDGHGAWDLERMAQVMNNLIGNALKYSAPGSTIFVRSEGDSDGIKISIHNTGAPIPAESIERIFQPMQRGTSQLENSARSVGLGLFIVNHLVRAHGGTLSVTSSAEEGTTFSVHVAKKTGPSVG